MLDPTSVVTAGLPSATSWYMNPYFMASFGAVVALGFVLFALAYFVFVKLKVGQPQQVPMPNADRCSTCGLTGDMMIRLTCKEHSGLVKDLEGTKGWIEGIDSRLTSLQKRVDNHIDSSGKKGRD